MPVKTITVTEDAYEALRAIKGERESFSETLLRITKKKPLAHFFGVLSRESADHLEKTILESRKKRNSAHQQRIKTITNSLQQSS